MFSRIKVKNNKNKDNNNHVKNLVLDVDDKYYHMDENRDDRHEDSHDSKDYHYYNDIYMENEGITHTQIDKLKLTEQQGLDDHYSKDDDYEDQTHHKDRSFHPEEESNYNVDLSNHIENDQPIEDENSYHENKNITDFGEDLYLGSAITPEDIPDSFGENLNNVQYINKIDNKNSLL
jgi:hypothetical protein